jgi:hypothetical protein
MSRGLSLIHRYPLSVSVQASLGILRQQTHYFHFSANRLFPAQPLINNIGLVVDPYTREIPLVVDLIYDAQARIS